MEEPNRMSSSRRWLRFVGGPTAVGAVTAASAAVLIPADVLQRVLAALRLSGDAAVVERPSVDLSSAACLVGCGFAVGYLGRKYLFTWLRWHALRALLRYTGWVYGMQSWKTRV